MKKDYLLKSDIAAHTCYSLQKYDDQVCTKSNSKQTTMPFTSFALFWTPETLLETPLYLT
jgi:hypothetical protein